MSSHWLSISTDVTRTYERVLSPLRSRLRFEPQPGSTFGQLHAPLVLVLGNHSSGKSTCINALLGRGNGKSCSGKGEVQRSGRAPTDAKFTVITAGEVEATHDGHAAMRGAGGGNGNSSGIGNSSAGVTGPALGLRGLRTRFGDGIAAQLELKTVRACGTCGPAGCCACAWACAFERLLASSPPFPMLPPF